MKTLIDAGKLDMPYASFSLELSPAQSEVLIGGYESDKYTGDLLFNDINTSFESWWTLDLGGFWMNDTETFPS